MNLYDENGYLDFSQIIRTGEYIFVIGARGIGKTFGALKYAIDNEDHFILMRRTQAQADMIRSDGLNPFNSLHRVLGDEYLFTIKPVVKNIGGIFQKRIIEDKEELIRRGYLMALSTISNIRGFDASDTDLVIYDEFIGEKHEKPIKYEGQAFLNAIETIARNRELEGKAPMKILCLANSSDLANPIFIELGLVKVAEKMIRKNIECVMLPERHISIIMPTMTPISIAKNNTSLYQMAGASSFKEMAIGNEFTLDFTEMVRSMSLKDFKPLVAVGEIVIYSHKSDLLYYVTGHMSGHPEIFGTSDADIRRFTNQYYYLRLSYLNRHIYFESYINQVLFERYFKMR